MLPFTTVVTMAIVITSLSSIAGAHVTSSSCSSYPSIPAEPVAPIPIFDLPMTYRAASDAQPADTIAQILNTLSLYPLAIDGKDFGALSLVFTADVYTNFSAPVNVLISLAAVQAGVSQALAFVDTQHSYGTQIVEVQTDCQARSVSYFTATHFGRGQFVGQVVYAYGQYQDTLIKLANNEWRIQTRNLVYMGPLIGNLSIFTPGT